jgi:hypothetical protein
MGTVMPAHVNEFTRRADGTEGGFANGLRLTNKSDDGTVGGLTGVNVEQQYALDTFHGIGYLLNDIWIAPLTKIRHALYKLFQV